MRILLPSLAMLALVSCGGGSNPPGNTTPTPPVSTNNPPIVAAANSDQTGVVGTAFNFDATQAGTTFSDADGDTLSFSISYSPDANGLTDVSGVISGTPAQDGTMTVTIAANDGNGGSVSDEFLIEVAAAPIVTKPNILLIISDDQGQDSSAQYSLSSDVPNTPVLNGLADAGLIFENAWVNPVCSPTRAGLITGRYGVRTTVLEPSDVLPSTEIILQAFMKNDASTSEYNSAMVGKWHLGGGDSGPNDMGLSHFAGITGGGVGSYTNWNLNINGTSTTNTNYVTSELVDQSISWIDDQTTPWFLWLSFNAPHTPFHLPPVDLHDRTLSADQVDIDADPRPYYLAAIEAMDTEIGRLLGSMTAQERADTIIIYVGDNGTPGAARDRSANIRGGKGRLNEGGIRVPMFASGAGVTRLGEREAAIVNNTDFFMTIAQLAGNTSTSQNDSQSFAEFLTNSSATYRDHTYSENLGGWTIRNSQYKLIELTDGSQTLYDLVGDPTEQDDLLIGSTDVNAILSELESAATVIRQ